MPVQFEVRPFSMSRIAARSALVVAVAASLTACQSLRESLGIAEAEPAAAQPPATQTATAQSPATPTAQPAVPPAAAGPQAVDFDLAIERAAVTLFTSAEQLPGIAPSPPRPVMIDPLIDGNSAQQTVASDAMGRKIAGVITTKFSKFSVAPFRHATLDRDPLVLIGTLTAINAANDPKMRNDVYRICLALVDIRAGKVLAKGVGRATEASVDATPLPYYADSPTLVKDNSADAYIRTCQGPRAGDPANPLYVQTIATSMLIDEALRAYNSRNFAEAQRLYRTALAMPAGEQKRVMNGLYLTSWRLNQRAEAEDVFGKLVTRGLFERQLGVRFLFQPGSTQFVADSNLRAQYAMWSRVLARRIDDTKECVKVVGHASKTGNPESNDRLSLRRAEQISASLTRQNASLGKMLTTEGVGSRETIIGSGTDDLRDALDRRVEFKAGGC